MRKIFYLLAVCLLSSCSIMVDTEDLIGLSISSWVDYGLEVSGITDFKIQKIDGEVYLTYTSGSSIQTHKLTYNGTGITSELLFSSQVDSTEALVLPINGKLATVVKNDDIIDVYIHTTDRAGKLLYTDLLSDYTVVESINSWTGTDGLAYISVIVDYTKIIVGRFDANSKWSVISTYDAGGRILDLDVKMGRSYPYAIWRSTANKMTLAAFSYANSSRSSWTTLATMNSIKSSQLSVENYTSPYTGILSEDVYVGVIGATYNEFQLYKLNSYKQLGRIGDYILNINGDYNFVNHKGLIVLAHLSTGIETPLTLNSISEEWSSSASIYYSVDKEGKMQAMLFDDAAALMLIEEDGEKVTIRVGKK